MPLTVSEKINAINKKTDNKEIFSTIAKYAIVIGSIYSIPYYYYFFKNSLFT